MINKWRDSPSRLNNFSIYTKMHVITKRYFITNNISHDKSATRPKHFTWQIRHETKVTPENHTFSKWRRDGKYHSSEWMRVWSMVSVFKFFSFNFFIPSSYVILRLMVSPWLEPRDQSHSWKPYFTLNEGEMESSTRVNEWEFGQWWVFLSL